MGIFWSVVVAVAAAGGTSFLVHMGRGLRQAAREDFRRDLIALGSVQTLAQSFTESLNSTEVTAFAPPRAEGRKQVIGWYWWRVAKLPDGSVVRTAGWALTYRRARRKASAPLQKAAQVEVVLRSKA